MSKRSTIILLIFLFVTPLLMSYFIFHFKEFFHLKKIHHGILLKHPINIANQLGNDHRWRLFYKPHHCMSEQTEKMLFTLRQLRIALGEDRERVRISFLTDAPCKINKLNVENIILSKKNLQNLARLTKMDAHNLDEKIYLIDPLNNLFMYYVWNTNAKDIYSDLKRVLSISNIG